TAGDGETGLQKAIEHKPDVILLDVMLPKLSGFDLCRPLRKQGMTRPISIRTARTQETDKSMSLALAADDYVTTPRAIAEADARGTAHVGRSKRFETTEANYVFGKFTLDIQGQGLRKDGVDMELSQKEFQMLKLFLENEGKVLSRQEILTKVW